MTWQGGKITGFQGAAFLGALSKKADEEALSECSKELKEEYNDYSPWMSNRKYRKKLQKLERPNLSRTNRSEIFSLKGSDLLTVSSDKNTKLMPESHPDEKRFYSELNKVNKIITYCDFSMKYRFQNLIQEINPQVSTTKKPLRIDGAGLSTHSYRKGIFISVPQKSKFCTVEFALNISHELGHQALMTYQCFDNIIKDNHQQAIYSVIRKTRRPSILSFHALIATVYMLEFFLQVREFLFELSDTHYLKRRFSELCNDLANGLNGFKNIKFTALGAQIYSELLAFYFYAQEQKI